MKVSELLTMLEKVENKELEVKVETEDHNIRIDVVIHRVEKPYIENPRNIPEREVVVIKGSLSRY